MTVLYRPNNLMYWYLVALWFVFAVHKGAPLIAHIRIRITRWWGVDE